MASKKPRSPYLLYFFLHLLKPETRQSFHHLIITDRFHFIFFCLKG